MVEERVNGLLQGREPNGLGPGVASRGQHRLQRRDRRIGIGYVHVLHRVPQQVLLGQDVRHEVLNVGDVVVVALEGVATDALHRGGEGLFPRLAVLILARQEGADDVHRRVAGAEAGAQQVQPAFDAGHQVRLGLEHRSGHLRRPAHGIDQADAHVERADQRHLALQGVHVSDGRNDLGDEVGRQVRVAVELGQDRLPQGIQVIPQVLVADLSQQLALDRRAQRHVGPQPFQMGKGAGHGRDAGVAEALDIPPTLGGLARPDVAEFQFVRRARGGAYDHEVALRR